MHGWINLSALWKICVIGLLAGAGLPALFAVGLRALSLGDRSLSGQPAVAGVGNGSKAGGSGGQVSDDRMFGGSVPGLVVAVVCFAVVLAAVGWGVYSVVNG